MNFDQFTKPQPIPLTKRQACDDAFREVQVHPENIRSIFIELHKFFISDGFSEATIQKYFFTYWKWYVWCAWDQILSVEKKEVEAFFSKQLTTAFMLGIPVIDRFFYFLYRQSMNKDELEQTYQRLKQSVIIEKLPMNPGFVTSSAPLADGIKMIAEMKNMTDDDRQKVRNQVADQLFPAKETIASFPEEERQSIVDDFVLFIQFLDENNTITDAVAAHMDLLGGNDLFGFEEFKSIPEKSVEEEKKVSEAKMEELSVENSKEPKQTAQLSIPTPTEIRTMIDSRFAKDAEGQYANVAGVLSTLQALSEKHNDPSLAELYYFDEKDGRFHWKID